MSSHHQLVMCPVCGLRRKRYVDSATQRDLPCAACVPLLQLLRNPVGPWAQQALCSQVDPEMFFPATGAVTVIAQCKAVCNQCPVRDECLAHALEAEERFGIWGGLTTKERRRLMKKGSAA